jgi:simple sugar transport system ATP-binding protein
LLISEDLDEILLLADRVIVMCGGRILGEFSADAVNREEIGMLMGGVHREDHPQEVRT